VVRRLVLGLGPGAPADLGAPGGTESGP
jgi:hypothetical protein